MTAATIRPPAARRALYGTAAGVLLASIVFEAREHATGYWQIAAFAIGPDLPLLFGGGRDLARGQLHPRAVPSYNLVHRLSSPVALAAATALRGVPTGYFIGALTWALHITLDRSLGYGLRTADGFQRG